MKGPAAMQIIAHSPTDYQQQFYQAIGLNAVPSEEQAAGWELYENPDVGFVHGFGSMDTVHCGIGSYTIPRELVVRYDYEFSYLHFGIIYRGVTYSLVNDQELAGPGPSAFVALEHSPVGVNRWKVGQQARGTEISICTPFLEQTLLPLLGLEPSCLGSLVRNMRYTGVPQELVDVVKRFEGHLVHHRITHAIMVALACEFVAFLAQPDVLAAIASGAGLPSEPLTVGTRTFYLTADEFKRVEEAHAQAEASAAMFPTAAALARAVGLSEQKLKAGFLHRYHQTIWDFSNSVRMTQAAALLRDTATPVSAVSRTVGYQSEAAFIAMFKKWSGSTPHRYRLEQRGRTSAPPFDR